MKPFIGQFSASTAGFHFHRDMDIGMNGTERALDSAIKLIPVVVAVYAAFAGVWRFAVPQRRAVRATALALLVSLLPLGTTATMAAAESRFSIPLLLASIWWLFLVLSIYVVYIFVSWPELRVSNSDTETSHQPNGGGTDQVSAKGSDPM